MIRGIYRASLLLIVVAGCGLADYEKRMDEQRERLKQFDEENALLYEIIDMPSGKDAYGNAVKPPFEVYLRLPVGFSGKFEGIKAIYSADKQLLFRYSGLNGKTEVNVLVAWDLIAEKNPKAPTKQEGVPPEDFRTKVRGALLDFITRTYSIGANVPDFNQLKKESKQIVYDGKPRNLEFELTTFDDSRQNRYYVFFQNWNDHQAAVIYQVPVQNADQKYLRMMDFSIKTLDIASGASGKRADFRFRPRV